MEARIIYDKEVFIVGIIIKIQNRFLIANLLVNILNPIIKL